MLNKIDLMGRIVRDVELRHTASGKAVASFTLAVSRDGKDSGVDFIDCVAWGGVGEFASRHFHKGSMAVVSGRLQMRDWQDKQGNKRRSAEVNVRDMYFGEAKKSDPGESVPVTAEFAELGDDGELPF